ncbi:4-hydroxy-tetrahydrodipicolinate synthase [Phycicoccus endophyticus]|uniref:4-hydroxy-tetrahydrodipicolinate synthase n=1 Tax=Phycicoccus endophyticus TaxID=1690220 RepID=A0A7G9R3R4_9MICO|nr:4-hydroxy-tetrahydrodipicolinate synthase [Phycicoccus endophyticus]NHI18061.1 4-hydroxy-tetrahydrodipicolinate synthase [Phycicoccus endophyticus]QNN50239.1 4-hydroxy-tetrahydrodipicolinate synthase [Phycicoccus endophyticus]GGL26748.1 4-hydroxy-tetrahydrodipicolinate synthase [Phycicoccus endophyticus]
MPPSPFGRVLTAMVTPMVPGGAVDEGGLEALVEHLLATGHDGLVVNGTTGEASTLTDEESIATVARVSRAAAGRARVVAGVGSNDTAHAVHMATEAARAGAEGLLLVSPYYNKPTQPGLVAHCRAVADATDLPVMLYDIPGRTGIAFAHETLLALAEHPRVLAVKDAKGDLWAATRAMAATDLLWFSGEDALNLPLLALGATGVVSVVGHVAGAHYRAMVEAVDRGDLVSARRLHAGLVPVVEALMTTSQGAIMAKAALVELGVLEHATVRLPLVESPPEHLALLRTALATLPTPKDS